MYTAHLETIGFEYEDNQSDLEKESRARMVRVCDASVRVCAPLCVCVCAPVRAGVIHIFECLQWLQFSAKDVNMFMYPGVFFVCSPRDRVRFHMVANGGWRCLIVSMKREQRENKGGTFCD